MSLINMYASVIHPIMVRKFDSIYQQNTGKIDTLQHIQILYF
jgi:hypothetical protein